MVIDLTESNLIDGLEDFWAGGPFDLTEKRRWARGMVLFIVDDSKLDTKQLFSKCTRAGVIVNQRSALGAALYKRAMTIAESDGQSTAIALGDAGSFASFTLFARGVALAGGN